MADLLWRLLCCGTVPEGSKLLDAAKAGDADTARSLVEKRPALARKAQQWGGQTAWHIAAREGHAAVLTALADGIRAADPGLVRATWGSDLGDTLPTILESLVCFQDSKGLSPLHLACIKGHPEAAGVLMELGANPFAVDSVGRTALHYAASWGFADCINAVLGRHSGPPKEGWSYVWPNSADTPLVDVQNASGFTPLHYAVWVGRKEAIQALASYDASLKVVNTSNDFEWIKVGSGNTPLHLAAFGGDVQVVKLLLAAYVQSLSAGAEVMAAGRGQWGSAHTDDVRHIRNRRGWMAYHIAIHKNFEHLAELLHPDIPYTFIFSNEDMAPGSVRMYGPARLMVIAAKALQQKLVDELSQVEADTTAAADRPAAEGKVAAVTGLAAAAAPEGDTADAAGAEQQVPSSPAVIGAPVGSTAAAPPPTAAAGGEGFSPEPQQTASIVSPFAARSGRGWTQSSFSAGPSEPTSAATSAAAVPTPTAPRSAAGTPTGSLGQPPAAGAAATAAAVAAATAAAAAVEVSPTGTDHTEHSFTAIDKQQQQQQGADAAAAAGTDPADGSFSGFALMPGSSGAAAAAAAGSSDVSVCSSVVPASNAAVAGSAPGSMNFGPASSVGGGQKAAQGGLSSTGQRVASVEASSTSRSVQWAPDRSQAGGSQHQQQPQQAVSLQQQHEDGRQRRVQSAVSPGYSRQGSRGLSDTAAGVRGSNGDQQHSSSSKFPWSRGDHLKMRGSKKNISADWLGPSAVQTSAEDDADGTTAAPNNRPGLQHNAANSSRRSSQDNNATTSSSNMAAPLIRRISSLPNRIGSGRPSAAAAAAAAAVAHDQQQQQQWSSLDMHLQHPMHENPLNVVLAARADQIGDNPEAIRQQLLAMKLASGALQFENAVSTFTAGPGAPMGSNRAASRLASFSAAMPASSRNSISSRAGVTGGAVSPAAQASAGAAAGPDATAEVVAAAAAAAAALPRIGSSEEVGGTAAAASPFAAPHQQLPASASDGNTVQQQQDSQQQQQQTSLSPSPSLFNITAANVIARQSSQSLQRLLSGNSRGTRRSQGPAGAGSWQQQQQQLTSPVPFAAGSGEVTTPGSSLNSSPAAPVFAAAAAAGKEGPVGELPIVQLQPAGAVAAMISEGSVGGDDEGVCEICFDAAAVVALQQCGHTLCVSCCKELCKLHHFKPGLCPYCRQIIGGFARATCVFIP